LASYRIRRVFRLLAAGAGALFLGLGFVPLIFGETSSYAVPMIFLFSIGGVLMLFAWIGRAPSWLEEYGLEHDEIVAYRQEMNRTGRFVP
jgi:hypothetical protein